MDLPEITFERCLDCACELCAEFVIHVEDHELEDVSLDCYWSKEGCTCDHSDARLPF